MRYAIGVDLGATNIKAVSVTREGEILETRVSPTEDRPSPSSGQPPLWAVHVREQIELLQRKQNGAAEWIGLAAPGLASADSRAIAFMPGRLQGLEGFVWEDFLTVGQTLLSARNQTRQTGVSAPPVRVPVLNDAHAALMGEIWKGAGERCDDAIMLTLGTGVGGAIFSGGRLLRGHIGRAGHLGHICLDSDGAPDIVGTPGSLEDAIGDCTLAARSGGRFHSSRDLVAAVAAGDAQAREIWLRSIRHLACAIASFVNILDPHVVIIGGGIAQAGAALFGPLEEELAKVEWRPGGQRVRIEAARLGDLAGALGAAYNAMGSKT